MRLTLTEKGKALHRDALSIPAQIAAAMRRPPEDLKAVRKELRRIRNTLLDPAKEAAGGSSPLA